MVLAYNKYMGGVVDINDQLLQYAALGRRSVKWWKKVLFRLLNLSMVNAYILFSEWKPEHRMTQTEFQIKVIKQLIGPAADIDTMGCVGEVLPLDAVRLDGKCHFIQKISEEGRLLCMCKVCSNAGKILDKRHGLKWKRSGRESAYQCKTCKV